MDFFQLSTFGSIAGTLSTILVMTYLYSLYRERHMGFWIISWAILLLRLFFFDYRFFDWTDSILAIITYQILQIILSFLFIYSIHLFSNKPFKKYWFYSATIIAIFSMLSAIMQLPFVYKLILPFLYSGAILLYTCKIFFNLKTKGIGKYITGGAFALWGMASSLYSFIYSGNTYLYLWISFICGILRLIITSGMLMVYFEKTRADLLSNQESLQQTNQELNHFCHSVAHDFKSPLLSINQLAKFIVRDYYDKLDRNGQELVTHIQNKSAEVVTITDHLLELSRMSQKQIKTEPVSLEELFWTVYSKLRMLGPQRQVEYTVAELPTVQGDPIMLEILATNILDNALKYTRNRQQTTIDVTFTEDENNYIVSVKDNGAGFDMEDSSRLFKILERLHPVDQFEGTGIGLVTCQKILKRHGGKAWITGKVDEGATFFFSFPKGNSSQPSNTISTLPYMGY
jgi:signal transduction histidine kinase